jgi:type I restriction enzyme, S subunit
LSILSGVSLPPAWARLPFGRLVSRSRIAGRPELEPLSVFLDDGVVPRSSRTDNHNSLGEDLSKYLVVKAGDIVFNKLRTWQGGLGVSQHEGIVSPAYFVCRPSKSVYPKFLHYLLRSAPYLAELTRISKFMPPSQFDISWEDLREVELLVPSMPTQRAIADFLDAETARIDALIAKRRALIDKLNERRAVLTACAVTGEVKGTDCIPSGLPWTRFIPADWRTAKLTLVARLGSGHTPSRDHPEWWLDCTIPWITTGEVSQLREDRVEYIFETREKISALGLANSSATLHPAGTVVLSRTASPGYSAIMGTAMATSPDYVTWTCGHLLEPRFLLLCLRAMRGDLLGRLAQGSTHKTIYMPDIETIRIPLPPLGEQRQIVEHTWRQLKMIDAAVQPITRQIDLLHERRQALITAAVTGELDVRGNAA